MTDLEYIDSFFSATLAPAEKEQFEQRISTDPAFAELVTFYADTLQVVTSEEASARKKDFREIYQSRSKPVVVGMYRRIGYGLAAAAVVTGIIFSALFFGRSKAPDQLAKQYVKDNFSTLPVTMGNNADSLQQALDLYNKGKLPEAGAMFTALAAADSQNVAAWKYAGVVALRRIQYSEAISRFHSLGSRQGLYANPGQFLEAVARMERNETGDLAAAKELLSAVVAENGEGAPQAAAWLKTYGK